MSRFSVILPAAGKSSRFRDKKLKKPFARLNGRAVWLHSAEKFINRDDVLQVILVISAEDREYFDSKFAANAAILGISVVEGGAERADSVERGLSCVKPEADFVCVHDAARPCLAEEWINQIFQAAEKYGGAIFATPITGTIKRVKDQTIRETVSRQGLWEAQTPQVFPRELLLEAYAQRNGFAATDEAQLIERLGKPVTIVPGSPLNRKISTVADLRLAEQTLKILPKPKLKAPAHPFADDHHWR